MNAVQYKAVLFVSTFAVALFVASPAIEQLMVLPQTESVSALALLGPQHIAADYPSAVKANQSYTVFLEARNQLGHAAYYMIQAKLQNKTRFDSNTQTPPLYNATVFVDNQQIAEVSMRFSFDYVLDENRSQVNLTQVTFNSFTVNPDANPFSWDPDRGAYVGYLVFELWLYNSTLGDFKNHGRSVNLVLTTLK
jgi:hypothetical protein